MKKIILALLLFTAFAGYSHAVIINVPGQHSTIQAAINASSNGDTVLVEPGTYMENIIFRGKKIVLTSRFYINNDFSYITSTIINGSTPSHPDSASVVRMHNGEDSTTVLQGFTITGGKGTKWQDEQGAGRYTEGGGILTALCHPIIQFNIIENNECVDAPGGIASTGGGGIRYGNGRTKILNNIIRNNRAMYGGGIVGNHGTGIIANNVIYNNHEFQAVAGKPCYGGGGVWLNGAGESSILINNTIVNNSASGPASGGVGGGVYVRFVTVDVRNNLLWGNTQRLGSQLRVSGAGGEIAYNNVEGGYPGPGNINIQPLFDSTNYYLQASSPCIDKGDSSIIYNDPADSLNPLNAMFPSRGTVRNDIGAYGGPLSSILANSIVGIYDPVISQPDGFRLEQNYPNPFNPSTEIRYSVAKTGFVQLKVFNTTGALISVLANSAHRPGSYSVVFNATELASGVYYYTLTDGGFTETKKMLLLK
jgi:hypothetical protein